MFDLNAQKKIISRALTDKAFRQELLRNPKAVLERELDITLAPEMNVQVHEDTPTTIHLVLPCKGQPRPGQELSDADLGGVAGGPSGNPWMRELSNAELGKVAGGPGGPPWIRELTDGELDAVAGGPTGHDWMQELSDAELGGVAGGPSGPPWMRQTADQTANQ